MVASIVCATSPAWGDRPAIRTVKASLGKRKTHVSARYDVIDKGEAIIGVRPPPPWDTTPAPPGTNRFLLANEASWETLIQILFPDGIPKAPSDTTMIPAYNSIESFKTAPNIFRLYGLRKEAISLLRKNPDVLFVSTDPGIVNIDRKVGLQSPFMNPKQINIENPGSVPFTDVTGVTQSSTKGIDIKSILAWRNSVGSPDVVVAIIDDSFDLTKPELKKSIYTNTKEIPCNGKDDDENGYVDDANGYNIQLKTGCVKNVPTDISHGTSMAITIAAPLRRPSPDSIVGIAPNVRFLPIHLDESFHNINEAFSYILTMKRRGVPIRVVNLSLGFPIRMTEKIQELCGLTIPNKGLTPLGEILDSDMTVVAAAGNRGSNNDVFPVCPANYAAVHPNIITVAAVDPAGKHPFFSNFGRESVTTSAPGSAVYTGYGYSSGTSIAAAHISGIVALMYSIDRSLTPPQVKKIIVDSTKHKELNLPTASGGIVSAYIATNKVVEGLAARNGGSPPPNP